MSPTPPSPFPDINRWTLKAGTELHRIHAQEFESNAFNPCKGRPTRFAPLLRPDGSCIPTAYAASSLECAVHETVFHEIQHDAPRKSIGLNIIERLDYGVLRPQRGLVLAALFEVDLNKWSLTRRDLIDTFAADYPKTAQWAIAIHDAHPDIDGLVWTSRRCDPERAFVFFGDRIPRRDLSVVTRQALARSNELLLHIRTFAARANIFLVF